jgi:hypothetical protein
LSGGVLCLNVEPVLRLSLAILNSPIIAILVIVGGSFAAQALAYTPGVNYAALFGFTALIGIVFTPIIALYAPQVVGQAAFLTLIVFGSLTAYTFVTRKDFSFMGGFLFVGILTIILAGAANLFFFKSRGSATGWRGQCSSFPAASCCIRPPNIIHHNTERDTVGRRAGFVHLVLQHLHVAAAHPGRQPRLIARDRIATEYSKGRGALASRPFCLGAAGVIH